MMPNNFNIVFPFQKIDREQRIVTGIATADNVDYEDDRISFEGSLNAFSNWIGNIREMHSPIAVGKLVDFRPVPVSYRGKSYNGIEVSVYISKGAEDTWQKILDGTLRGFSIGGRSMDADMEYDEDLQRQVRVIKEYVLGELSVVDNPCNPAGMFTMVKMMPDGSLEYEQSDEFDDEDDSDLFDKAISDVNLTPTDAMAAAARRGLEWRDEYNRGGTAVGVARARDIANKKTLSPSTVRRMKSFFARHEVDKKASGWNSGEDGFPSAGRIAWELWGGEPGKTWANSKDAQLDREEKMVKSTDEQRVFYCEEDKYAVFGDDNTLCPVCMNSMAQIGFAEAFNSEVINKMILNFNKKGGEESMDLQDNNVSDSVSDMSDLTETQREGVLSKLGDLLFGNKDSEVASVVPNVTVNIDGSLFSKGIMTDESDTVEDEVVADEVAEETTAEADGEVAETEDDTVEKSVEVDEESASDTTGGEEMDLNEILEKFTSVLDEKLEKVKADIAAEVDEKITKSVEEAQEATSETIEKLNDEVEKIADTGAVKKSVDAGDEDADVDDEDVVEKSVESFWGGRFVPTSVAKALGYDS
jgi:hypothetical protein